MCTTHLCHVRKNDITVHSYHIILGEKTQHVIIKTLLDVTTGETYIRSYAFITGWYITGTKVLVPVSDGDNLVPVCGHRDPRPTGRFRHVLMTFLENVMDSVLWVSSPKIVMF